MAAAQVVQLLQAAPDGALPEREAIGGKERTKERERKKERKIEPRE